KNTKFLDQIDARGRTHEQQKESGDKSLRDGIANFLEAFGGKYEAVLNHCIGVDVTALANTNIFSTPTMMRMKAHQDIRVKLNPNREQILIDMTKETNS
ncbi:2579_t:CDS:2, partial [Acaulospora colombiana]